MSGLKNVMRNALAVVAAMVAFVGLAIEEVELLDVNQGDPDKSILTYKYRVSGLDSDWSYKLRTSIRAKAGEPSKRAEKTVVLTNDISSADGTVTKTVDLASVFGPDVHPDCEVLLSLIGAVDETPPGTICDFLGKTAPLGYLACDGAEVSRTDYPRLFKAIGTLYGSGNGKTTFNLPNCAGRVSQGPNAKYAVGASIPAGLPNIYGKFSRNVNNAFGCDGKLFRNLDYGGGSGGKSGPYSSGVSFNASRYNPIYGKSDTVQPEAIVVLKMIKY